MSRKKSIAVPAKPAVLKYFIENSGWAAEELGKKIKVSGSAMKAWLDGSEKPTLNQLENLSAALKRPLAAFLLPEPPQEKPFPKDYRMIPGKEGNFDKNTILAFRRARRLQKISAELSRNLNFSTKAGVGRFQIHSDPKKAGLEHRKAFGVTEEIQRRWKSPYEAFGCLREMIEGINILVFQMPMPLSDARGFSLSDDEPTVIVVNSKDLIEAKIFTLMHEFGHVLLGDSGVSMPEKALFAPASADNEKWCNDFASGFLLPESMVADIFSPLKSSITETATLNGLSRKYKLSKAMLLYSMFKSGYIDQRQYGEVLDRYKPTAKKEPKEGEKKPGGFGRSSEDRCVSEMGQKFISLVIANMERGNITQSDALDYLSIKSKNLNKVAGRLKK